MNIPFLGEFRSSMDIEFFQHLVDKKYLRRVAQTGFWDVGAALQRGISQSSVFWFVFLAMQKMNASRGERQHLIENQYLVFT